VSVGWGSLGCGSLAYADYCKVEIDPYVKELAHLTKDEKQVLGETLKKFSTFFRSGLGMLNIKPVRL
jgi:hypothetical protein